MKGLALTEGYQTSLQWLTAFGVKFQESYPYMPGKDKLIVLVGLMLWVVLLPNTQQVMQWFQPKWWWAVGVSAIAFYCLRSLNQVIKNFQAVISSYLRKEDRYKNYQISNQRLKDLRTIIDTCRQRNIPVKVFFLPTHAVQLQTLHIAGLSSVYQQWQREVVKIIPTWDFSGYSQINTEPLSGEMKNYVDGAHFQYRIADLILNRMFQYQLETVPSDFGVLLTPETIEPHLAAVRADQIVWQKNHPKMIKFVQDLYAKANR